MALKDTYLDEFTKLLTDKEDLIENLTAQAEKAETKAGDSYHKEVENLKDRLRFMREKIEEIRTAGEGTWEKLATELDTMVLEFKNISLSLKTKLEKSDEV